MASDKKSEKVKFQTVGNETLVGELVVPDKPDPKFIGKVVVFIHGLYQHKNIAFLKSFGQRIPKELGIATFRFDCRGLGESTGQTKYTPHFQNLQDLEVRSTAEKISNEPSSPSRGCFFTTSPAAISLFLSLRLPSFVKAALVFLSREHQLQPHCLFGYSAGGNVAILHASQNPGAVPYIVNCSGRFKMDGVVSSPPFSPSFLSSSSSLP